MVVLAAELLTSWTFPRTGLSVPEEMIALEKSEGIVRTA